MDNEDTSQTQPENTSDTTIPSLCPNCGATGTISIITKTIGGISKDYYQCSECRYRWAVPVV